jgi:hypothetical protein
MADITFRFDLVTAAPVDANGNADPNTPRIGYQAKPSWKIVFGEADSVLGTFTPVDVSSAVAWAAAVDNDFTHNTEPMVRVLDADIDVTGAASGEIIVPLDANTATFLAAVTGENFIRDTWFELRGLNADANVIFYAKFQLIADNTIDPSGGTPPAPAGNYYSKTEIDALLRAGLEVQFSVNGSTSWHATQDPADRYYQFRYPGGEWSSVIAMIVPTDGTDAPEVEVEYSADGLTDWHTPPVAGDRYIRFSTDGGATWGDALLTGALTKDDLEFDDGDLGEGDILLISGTTQVGEVLNADGEKIEVPITYGTNTELDFSAFAPLTGTWMVRFANGGAAPLDALENPMTTAGDIIIGGADGTPERLAAGTEGHVLKIVSGVPAYAAESGGGGGADFLVVQVFS